MPAFTQFSPFDPRAYTPPPCPANCCFMHNPLRYLCPRGIFIAYLAYLYENVSNYWLIEMQSMIGLKFIVFQCHLAITSSLPLIPTVGSQTHFTVD